MDECDAPKKWGIPNPEYKVLRIGLQKLDPCGARDVKQSCQALA